MIKEGWLTKCGGSHKSWKKRWFILQENLLYYFADKKARGLLSLTHSSAKIEETSSRNEIHISYLQFLFRASFLLSSFGIFF